MQRLLAIVPWVAAADGPRIDEVCRRFGVSRQQLERDLNVVWMVGTWPYTPDQLIEVTFEDDRVWIRYADVFRRPLRLTPAEALELITVGAAALAFPGADRKGPLATALAKVAEVLGVDRTGSLDVDIGTPPPAVFGEVERAVSSHRAVELDYYSYGRDERSLRVVEPWRLFNEQGQWYMSGHCRTAGGERIFRLDRVAGVKVLDEQFTPSPELTDSTLFNVSSDAPRVTLRVDAEGSWLVEQYPVDETEREPAGTWLVCMAITTRAVLERLLLQLGGHAEVVDIDPRLGGADIAAVAARRVLARYTSARGSSSTVDRS